MSEAYYRQRLEAVKDERDALQASNDRLWARCLELKAECDALKEQLIRLTLGTHELHSLPVRECPQCFDALKARVAELEAWVKPVLDGFGLPWQEHVLFQGGGRESGSPVPTPAAVQGKVGSQTAAANPAAPGPGVAEAEELARRAKEACHSPDCSYLGHPCLDTKETDS